MTDKEKTALKHAEAIKKFCEKHNSIECIGCVFNGGTNCRLWKSAPKHWTLPTAEERKK